MRSSLVKNAADMILVAIVIRAGSISDASRVVGLERSALGRRLAALESRLGIPLFDRSSQKIRVTDTGHAYFQYCQCLLELAEEAESVAAAQTPIGRAVLSIFVAFDEAGVILAPIVRDFRNAHDQTEVSVRIFENSLGEFPENTDLVIGVDTRRQSDLTYHEIARLQCSLWAHQDYLEAAKFDGNPLSITQLDCVGVADASDGVQTWHLSNSTSAIDVPVTNIFRLPTLRACRDACAEKAGIALLPDYLCIAEEQSGALIRVTPNWRPEPQRLVASHRKGIQGMDRTRLFIEFCRRRDAAALPSGI